MRLATLATLAAAACGQAESRPAAVQAPAAVRAPVEPRQPVAPAASDDVHAVLVAVQAWLDAQNEREPYDVEVDVDTVRVDADGGPPYLVSFVQRYRRGEYADHGLKRLVLDEDLEIVREETVWSVAGWDDEPSDPVDATWMKAPITLRMSAITGAPDGGCHDREIELVVEDADGVTESVVIGYTTSPYVDGDSDPEGTVLQLAPGGGKALYEANGTKCIDLEVGYELRRAGDTLVAFERSVDTRSRARHRTAKRPAVMLPPGATVTPE